VFPVISSSPSSLFEFFRTEVPSVHAARGRYPFAVLKPVALPSTPHTDFYRPDEMAVAAATSPDREIGFLLSAAAGRQVCISLSFPRIKYGIISNGEQNSEAVAEDA
jgi:hypothetical protein